MNKTSLVVAMLFAAASLPVQAHSHLRSSVPAEGSTVGPPLQVLLGFSEKSQLAALSLAQGSAAAVKVAPLPQQAAQDLSVAIPKLTPGAWSLNWRVIGDDGHITHGTVHFTVR